MEEKEIKPNGLWEFVKVVAISLLVVIPIRTWIAQPFIVEGSSMEPNFHNGEYLIIDELTYAFKAPTRGDIIVFRYPLNPSDFFIKRIIGLPGETVEIKNSAILIQTRESDKALILDESYLPKNILTVPDETIKLEKDKYFVMGDIRIASSDSRIWGLLPAKNITGRVLIRLWPIDRIGIIK